MLFWIASMDVSLPHKSVHSSPLKPLSFDGFFHYMYRTSEVVDLGLNYILKLNRVGPCDLGYASYVHCWCGTTLSPCQK